MAIKKQPARTPVKSKTVSKEVPATVATIKAPKTAQPLSNLVDFQKLYKTYNLEGTRQSFVQYVAESIRWFDGLLVLLATISSKHRSQISAAQKLTSDLLSSGEHDDQLVLINRTGYLVQHLNFGMDVLQTDLLALKHEVLSWNEALYAAKSLEALCELESRRRPDFSLVAEHSFAMVKRYLQRLDWFLENQKPVSLLIALHNEWRDDFHAFEHASYDHFMEKCRHKKIHKQVAETWFTEWQQERLVIEEHLLALMKAAIDDKVIPVELAIKAATVLKVNLCDKLNDFFDDWMMELHIKIDLKPGYELMERFEKDVELALINAGFQEALENLIFKIDSIEGRLFLTRWAKDWYDALIGDVLAYVEQGSLLELVAKTTLDGFRIIKQRNLEAFLVDAKSYAEARVQKDNEFNELMYRMKQDLIIKVVPKVSRKKGINPVA